MEEAVYYLLCKLKYWLTTNTYGLCVGEACRRVNILCHNVAVRMQGKTMHISIIMPYSQLYQPTWNSHGAALIKIQGDIFLYSCIFIKEMHLQLKGKS